MHFLLLPLLTLPSVLGDCTRFVTTDFWNGQSDTSPGYRFLANEPIRQVSDIINCPPPNNQGVAGQPECGITDNSANCKVPVDGGVSVTARFSVTPTNNSVEALEAFFKVVAKAVGADGRDDGLAGRQAPQYQVCGNLKVEYEKLAGPPSTPGYCITPGATSWAEYIPPFICVNGTAEDCTNGPFESGTKLVVCGVGKLAGGSVYPVDNLTISRNGQTYQAKDQNPAVNSGLTCKASLGIMGFEVEPWSYGVMGLAIISGLLF
ncbi:hypothetical protein TWF281_001802 [Arthrobotrys megalospora]